MAESRSKSKRKARSDKFPLTLHATGQYCKKIKGKIYYFGTDKKIAHRRYLEQAADLHGCPYGKFHPGMKIGHEHCVLARSTR